MSSEKTSGVRGFFHGLKTEYKKIIFPTKEDVVKQSAATLIVGILIGALIAVLDLIMKTGLGFILK